MVNIAQAISFILMVGFAIGGAYGANLIFGPAIAVIWAAMMIVTWVVVQVYVGGGTSSSSGQYRQSKGARQGRD